MKEMIKKLNFLKQKKFWIIGICAAVILVSAFFIWNNLQREDFILNTNTIFMKLSIPVGGSSETSIKITNMKDEDNFNVALINFKDVAFLEESSFKLEKEESKEIKIFFSDSKNQSMVYTGQVVVLSSKSEKKIPIILKIEDKNSKFAIIPEMIQAYERVYPGGKFGVKIKIYNVEDNELHSVRMTYLIKNLNDEILFSEEENIAVKGNIELNKIIDIPKNIPKGNYVFVVYLDSQGIKSVTGYLFSVADKENAGFSASGNFNVFFMAILIFLIAIVIIFFYFMKTRDELFFELKKQQNTELKKNLQLIENYRWQARKLNVPERKNKILKIKKIRKKIIYEIKAKQKKQKVIFKKLRKKGKKKEALNLMKKWQREGYKMIELKKEKAIPEDSIKKQVEQWREEGYKTDVLKR